MQEPLHGCLESKKISKEEPMMRNRRRVFLGAPLLAILLSTLPQAPSDATVTDFRPGGNDISLTSRSVAPTGPSVTPTGPEAAPERSECGSTVGKFNQDSGHNLDAEILRPTEQGFYSLGTHYVYGCVSGGGGGLPTDV